MPLQKAQGTMSVLRQERREGEGAGENPGDRRGHRKLGAGVLPCPPEPSSNPLPAAVCVLQLVSAWGPPLPSPLCQSCLVSVFLCLFLAPLLSPVSKSSRKPSLWVPMDSCLAW
jgi:hypothetical protein